MTKTPLRIRSTESGRKELAEWIASKDNPLTARVYVNRVWSHLFGRGIVPTPDNFGAAGQPPSNQVLLDHLAVTFMQDGWSTKKLIRRLVLSHAAGAQLSEASHVAELAVDFRVVRQCLQKELTTIARCRALTAQELVASLGARSAAALGRALTEAGFSLAGSGPEAPAFHRIRIAASRRAERELAAFQ